MNKEYQPCGIAGICGMVLVSLFLGMTALVVSFVAASAFETKGTTSNGEVIAKFVATAPYLVFCQFWVTPRGRGRFGAKLLIGVALIAPVLVTWVPPAQRILWLVTVCLSSVVGVLIAHWLTIRPQRITPLDASINCGKSCRNYLRVGFILVAAMALVISIGVIPSVVTDTTHGSYAHTNGVFLAWTVVFDLLAVALLASAVWRSRAHDRNSKATLGITAFLALLLSLIYCGFGVLTSGYGPALRIASVLLFLCAAFGLITTALMSVTSVIVDRARLSA